MIGFVREDARPQNALILEVPSDAEFKNRRTKHKWLKKRAPYFCSNRMKYIICGELYVTKAFIKDWDKAEDFYIPRP